MGTTRNQKWYSGCKSIPDQIDQNPSKIGPCTTIPLAAGVPAAKVCTSCGNCKPAGEFFPAPLHPGGLTPRCKRCILAAAPASLSGGRR